MSLEYGFYNGNNGDRKYDSRQISQIFEGIINDGIYMSVGDKFMVSENSGMNVLVGSGRAWMQGTWTANDTDLALTVDDAEVVLNRIDTIVIEVDLNARMNAVNIVKGTPASSPIPPTLEFEGGVYQYPLADIEVLAGATSIAQGDITNRVGTVDMPFVTGIIDTIDSSTLLTQWEAQFQTWFSGLQDVLDTNTESNLLNLINAKPNIIGGSEVFNTTTGVTITHNLGHQNYQVAVLPSGDSGGFIGEIYTTKADNTVTIYCTGSDTTTSFDYIIKH